MAIIKRDKVLVDGEETITLSPALSVPPVEEIDPQNVQGIKEPGITVNKTNGIVNSIDLICTCGRKTHIVCEYEEKPKI